MRGHARWKALREIVVGGVLAVVTVVASPLLRRWYNRWGTTDDELARPLPGDELVKEPKLGSTRAIAIEAPPERVWRWLAQNGQGRGGFYSFDALENLVGCNIHSVDRILPEHQNLAVGDIVRSGKDQHICWVVVDLDPPHRLILQGAGTPANVAVPDVVDEVPDRGYAASTWQWVLEPIAGGRHARVIVRQRCTYSPRQALLWHIVEPLNFVMEREILRGPVELRAEVTGTGPVCALLRPIGLGTGCGDPVAERLAGDRTVVAVDLPGYGSPSLPAGTPWTVQRLTDAVADFLTARWPGPIDVAGVSLGGAIALELARRGAPAAPCRPSGSGPGRRPATGRHRSRDASRGLTCPTRASLVKLRRAT